MAKTTKSPLSLTNHQLISQPWPQQLRQRIIATTTLLTYSTPSSPYFSHPLLKRHRLQQSSYLLPNFAFHSNLLSRFVHSSNLCSPFESIQPDSVSPKSAAAKGLSSAESNSGFPSRVRNAGLNSNGKSGGPAFVGQVFSMCDLSGTGLMAASTHFDIPFISNRSASSFRRPLSQLATLLIVKQIDSTLRHKLKDNVQANQEQRRDLRFSFEDWLKLP